ncbi:PPK2 family polyphosphate kinase [Carnobacterium pleistocenium]|uniref:PPK2 family polyphosphate kinase n=1 Tax=Carnobacterium pleistocenium TaxID=181073 RepID=UPI00055366B1|nr:phosphate--nucleotide phosphotransferase [Carnobacterium pleistocenium]
MDSTKYRVTPDKTPIKLTDYPTTDNDRFSEDELQNKLIPESIKKLQDLHLKLHAEEEKSIMVVLQAIDAGGKDEAISFIFSNLTAQGLKTTSVKKPSKTEVKHDYLWRIHEGKPARGEISILNRSYYEEVIAPRIHDVLDEDPLPDHLIDENIWKMRFRQLNDFERYMKENGFPVIKFFFNVSKDIQKERLLERMKDPKKNWEFSFSDIEERKHWDTYQEVFEEMLNHTSTEYAPWYVLPADDDWYARYIISEVMIEVLEKLDPQFPEISGDEQKQLKESIELLEND